MTTKILGLTDAPGNLVRFVLLPSPDRKLPAQQSASAQNRRRVPLPNFRVFAHSTLPTKATVAGP
jgi:hypothetical protein